jgi:hypothetical protein
MTEAMTTETPAKVFSLLAAALASLAFMFCVSTTDASFSGTLNQVPDPFAPAKVVSVIDRAAASYSSFLSANFINPLVADYKVYGDNLAWIAREGNLAYYMGVDNLGEARQLPQGRVAGAYTEDTDSSGGLSIDNLYSILIR